jgi:O-antigen ligase
MYEKRIAGAGSCFPAGFGVWAPLLAFSVWSLFFLLPLKSDPSLIVGLAAACGLLAARGCGLGRLNLKPAGLVQYAACGFAVYAGLTLVATLLHPETLTNYLIIVLWVGCIVSGFMYSRVWPGHTHGYFLAIPAGIIVSVIIAVFLDGNASALWQGHRLKLLAIHPARLALYGAAGLFFCLQAAFYAGSRWISACFAGVSLLLCGLIYLTGTRSVILLLPVGLACLVFTLPRERRLRLGLALLILVLGWIAFVWISKQQVISNRVISAVRVTSDQTFLTRVRIWEAGWEAFKDSPLIGYGVKAYSRIYSDYLDRHRDNWNEQYRGKYDSSAKNVHNMLLARLLEGGILGAAGFFLFYFCGILAAVKGPPQSRWIVSLLIFYLGIGLMDDTLFRRNDSFVIFILGSTLGLLRENP